MMKRKIMSSLLAGVLTAGMVVSPAAEAATAPTAGITFKSAGTGAVYNPADIIDVIVPTEFKVAFNPMKVNVSNATDGLSGNTQVLSGTYAIQNRSTIPVKINAAFTVTTDTKTTKADTEKNVAAYDAADQTKATLAEFSMDVVTTAKGTAQAMSGTVTTKSDDKESFRGDDSASKVTISKLSTQSIPLTAATPATKNVEFMLAAGPYALAYNKDSNKVEYKVNAKGTFDTVGFKFTGTTTTNSSLWGKVSTAPTVTATYTLTKSTQNEYAAQPFSPYSKDVTIKTGETDVKVTKDTDGTYTFKTAPVLTTVAETGEVNEEKNNVTVLSLLPNSVADSSKSLKTLGIKVTKTSQDGVDTYKATIAKETVLDAGFYMLTIGKQSFTVEVQK